MRLNQIQYFLRVCETQSISRAAEQLNVAQSALSRHIRDLEIEIGADLFKREGRGIVLTPAGLQFKEKAQQAMALLSAGAQEARHTTAVGANIVVGLPPPVSAAIANGVQEDYLNATGGQLRVIEGWTEFLADWVTTQRLNFAVAYDRSAQDRAFRSTPICRERYYVIYPYAGEHREQRIARFADLADKPLVAPSPGHALRDAIDAKFHAVSIEPRVRLEIDSAAGIKQAVSGSNFYAILAGGDILHDYRHAGLSADPIPIEEFTRTIHFIWRSGTEVEPNEKVAMDGIRERMRAQPFCFLFE